MKQNWFETLNAALESEGLVDTFPDFQNISYGQTIQYAIDGLFVTIYRETDGRYERPIHYETKRENFVRII